MKAISAALAVVLLIGPPMVAEAQAKRDANDPRRKCREAIQKSQGQGKDAKVSRKAIDRCVENGGQI